MTYALTQDFLEKYQALTDAEVVVMNALLLRIEAEDTSAWARAGEIVGENGQAWICRSGGWRIYWDYADDESSEIIFKVLLKAS